jgi:hypothetical protein
MHAQCVNTGAEAPQDVTQVIAAQAERQLRGMPLYIHTVMHEREAVGEACT